MPTPELTAPVPWHPSVLLVCPKAAAKILPDIPTDPLQIPLAGFPWPPAIILHSLSASFSILRSTPSPAKKSWPGVFSQALSWTTLAARTWYWRGKIGNSLSKCLSESSAVEKSFLFTSWQGGTRLWNAVSSGLVETCSDGAGGCTWRKESMFLCVVPSAVCYQHLIAPYTLERLPWPQ